PRGRAAREVGPTGAWAADPLGQEPAEARPPRRMMPLRGGLWRIYLTGFLCMIVFGGSFALLGPRLQHDPWRLSEGAVALFFLIYLVGTVVTTYYGRLATKFPRTRITLVGM